LKFIIGIGRSGTSLIQSFLFGQADQKVLPENQLIRRIIIANPVDRSYTQQDLHILFKRNNPRFNNLLPFLKELALEFPVTGLEFLKIADKKFDGMIEKDARNIDYISIINKNIDSQYLLCIRDIRDVLISRRKAQFSKRWTFLMDLFICKLQILGYFNHKHKATIYIQKYEDFLEGRYNGVSELIKSDQINSKVDYQQVSKVLFSEEELSKHKTKNRDNVISTNKGNWQKASRFFVWMADAFFYDYNLEFGYKTVYKSYGLIFINKIVNTITDISYPIYLLYSKYRDRKFYRI